MTEQISTSHEMGKAHLLRAIDFLRGGRRIVPIAEIIGSASALQQFYRFDTSKIEGSVQLMLNATFQALDRLADGIHSDAMDYVHTTHLESEEQNRSHVEGYLLPVTPDSGFDKAEVSLSEHRENRQHASITMIFGDNELTVERLGHAHTETKPEAAFIYEGFGIKIRGPSYLGEQTVLSSWKNEEPDISPRRHFTIHGLQSNDPAVVEKSS